MTIRSSCGRGALILGLSYAGGCASTDHTASPDTLAASAPEDLKALPIDKMIEEVESEIANSDPDTEAPPDAVTKAEPEMVLELNANVQRWIEYFTGRDRERFERFLNRGEPYRDMIEATLEQNELPRELYFLALIESGFQTHAASRAKAVGIWQFIRPTGVRYGLAVNQFTDERFDPVRSTNAAALYLGNLHNVFNSWYLAMAAYNAGETRIMNAIMKQNTRNFWTLVKRNALPRETMEYIPKFIAAATIGRNPERFGFSVHNSETLPQLVSVDVPAALSFKDMESITGVPQDVLRRFNPALKKGMTPPGRESYGILVPEANAASFSGKASLLAQAQTKGLPEVTAVDDSSEMPKTHRVRRGESLVQIADKYQLSLQQLRQFNQIKGQRVRRGTILHLIAQEKSEGPSPFHYRVRRGDSLRAISARFGVPIHTIKAVNSLRSNKIYAGDVLKITSKQG